MKPMLGIQAPLDALRYPLYASAKLDGIRGLVVGGKLRSRKLLPIPNRHVTALLSDPNFNGLDGELIFGDPTAKNCYRATNSAVSSEAGAPEITFYVFDDFSHPGSFESRLASLTSRAMQYFPPWVKLLPQVLIRNEAELRIYEERVLELGFEGLILRSPIGRYKQGRSTVAEHGMLKIKRFVDGEAEILEVIEEEENTNRAMTDALGHTKRSSHQNGKVGKGTCGALRVRDCASGIEFKVGSGIDDAEGAKLWRNRSKVVGSIIKYKHFLIGAKDKPRHPIYLGPRQKWDL